MWYTIIVALAILGTSLVVAQDDPCTCTKYGLDIHLPGSSCVDIYKNPTSHGRSGYHVLKIAGHLINAYCDMELDCGGNKGGWMRIIDIKKGDTCPSGWTKYNFTVQEVQQLAVILLAFQQIIQATV